MKIEILPSDPSWPDTFTAEAARWHRALPGLLDLHHIGSTSVPGLPAKPIIDMIPVFGSAAMMDAAQHHVQQLGYEWLGEFGLPGRRYCRLNDPETGTRLFQAHCYVLGSAEITRHLAFRDALRANAALRAGYSSVKGKCAALYPGDITAYGDCKSDWIKKVEARALADLADPQTAPKDPS